MSPSGYEKQSNQIKWFETKPEFGGLEEFTRIQTKSKISDKAAKHSANTPIQLCHNEVGCVMVVSIIHPSINEHRRNGEEIKSSLSAVSCASPLSYMSYVVFH